MKVLAFAASNSRTSINQRFALWAANQIPGATVETLNIDDYELPIYSPEREQLMGSPELALAFLARLKSADALVISYAEYNGNYTSAWKNLTDWLSRTERKYFYNKPLLLLGTSTGAGGARRVLELAKINAEHVHGSIVDTISLPEFHQHYNEATQSVEHPVVALQVQQAISNLLKDLPELYKESVY